VRILFLTHRLPYAPNRGDRIRAYYLLRHLSTWAEVHLLSLVHDADEASHAAMMTSASSVTIVPVPRVRNLARGLLSLPTNRPLTHVLLDGPTLASRLRTLVSAHPPVVVLAYCSGMARLALDPPLGRIPFVIDMIDVDSAKWEALSLGSSGLRSWVYARESRLLSRFEAHAARVAFANLVVAPREREILAAVAPDARIAVVPLGVDTDTLRPPGPPASGSIVVFCGVMNYTPNVDAAIWLARKVWPLVREKRPDARLQIVGASPVAGVRALADHARGIEVTGTVDDIRPHLWGAAVSVAPLQVARGVQNKVLEAIAAGLPVVVTPVVREGLPREALAACAEAGDVGSFAQAVVDFLAASPDDRRERARAADLTSLSWERCFVPIRHLLEEAAESRR
jgi:sugar transferase (PEP-CTERM/EpsH1 system associated)